MMRKVFLISLTEIKLNKIPIEAKHNMSMVHSHQSDLRGEKINFKEIQAGSNMNSPKFKDIQGEEKLSRSFKKRVNLVKGSWFYL